MKKGIFAILLLLTMLLYLCMGFAENNEEDDNMLFVYSIVGTSDTYVDLEATPGEEVSFSIVLKNSGTTRKTNNLFISDGYTGNNGGTMILMPEEAKREKAGSWFNISEEEVTLEPNEERVFDFIISVPQNVTPGTHVAVIYLRSTTVSGEESEESKEGASFKINKAYALSSAVIIRTGGETIYDFIIEDDMEQKWIKDKDLVLLFYIANTGNTYDYPKVTILMYGSGGELTYEAEKELGIVYPENACQVDFLIPPEQYIDGTYKIVFSLDYAKEKTKNVLKEFILDLTPEEVETAIKETEKEEIKYETEPLSETMILIGILIGIVILVIAVTIIVLWSRRRYQNNRLARGITEPDLPRAEAPMGSVRDTWNDRGLILSKQGKYRKAEKAFKEAIKIDKKYKEAWYNLSFVLSKQEKYREAADACKKAIKIDRKYKKAWSGVGFILSNQGKYRKAEKAFKEAIKIDKKYKEAWVGFGFALNKQGKYKEAESVNGIIREME